VMQLDGVIPATRKALERAGLALATSTGSR
jgi:hypothetical protein